MKNRINMLVLMLLLFGIAFGSTKEDNIPGSKGQTRHLIIQPGMENDGFAEGDCVFYMPEIPDSLRNGFWYLLQDSLLSCQEMQKNVECDTARLPVFVIHDTIFVKQKDIDSSFFFADSSFYKNQLFLQFSGKAELVVLRAKATIVISEEQRRDGMKLYYMFATLHNYDVAMQPGNPEDTRMTEEKISESNWWIWLIAAVIVLLAIVLVYRKINSKINKDEKEGEAEKPVASFWGGWHRQKEPVQGTDGSDTEETDDKHDEDCCISIDELQKKLHCKNVIDVSRRVDELVDLEKKAKELTKGVPEKLKMSSGEIPSLASLLDRWIEELSKKLTDAGKKIEDTNKELNNVKMDPSKMKDKEGYEKLKKLVEDSEKFNSVKKRLKCDDLEIEDVINSTARMRGIINGSLTLKEKELTNEDRQIKEKVEKAARFDEILADPNSLLKDNQLNGCKLYELLNEMKTILSDPQKIPSLSSCAGTELYKLIQDVVFIKKVNHAEVVNFKVQSSTLDRSGLTGLISNSNYYNELKKAVSGKKDGVIPTVGLPQDDITQALNNANAFMVFASFKTYFRNMMEATQYCIGTLSDTDDEKATVRMLLFYVSQLNSISMELGKTYGYVFPNEDIKMYTKNIDLFRKDRVDVSDYPSKYPLMPQLNSLPRFQRVGSNLEQPRLNYLGKNKPIDFILNGNYYPDVILPD